MRSTMESAMRLLVYWVDMRGGHIGHVGWRTDVIDEDTGKKRSDSLILRDRLVPGVFRFSAENIEASSKAEKSVMPSPRASKRCRATWWKRTKNK